jgi:hypothetical protein
MTIRIYDIAIDEMRDATQEDVDKLIRIANAYGMLRSFLNDQMGLIAAAHEEAHRIAGYRQEIKPQLSAVWNGTENLRSFLATNDALDGEDEISPFVAQ